MSTAGPRELDQLVRVVQALTCDALHRRGATGAARRIRSAPVNAGQRYGCLLRAAGAAELAVKARWAARQGDPLGQAAEAVELLKAAVTLALQGSAPAWWASSIERRAGELAGRELLQ